MNRIEEPADRAWGRVVYRWRWTIVVLSVIPLLPALWLVLRGGDLDTSVVPLTTESGRAAELIVKELPRGASFELIFSDPRRPAVDPSFRDAVMRALDPLRRDPRSHRAHRERRESFPARVVAQFQTRFPCSRR